LVSWWTFWPPLLSFNILFLSVCHTTFHSWSYQGFFFFLPKGFCCGSCGLIPSDPDGDHPFNNPPPVEASFCPGHVLYAPGLRVLFPFVLVSLFLFSQRFPPGFTLSVANWRIAVPLFDRSSAWIPPPCLFTRPPVLVVCATPPNLLKPLFCRLLTGNTFYFSAMRVLFCVPAPLGGLPDVFFAPASR